MGVDNFATTIIISNKIAIHDDLPDRGARIDLGHIMAYIQISRFLYPTDLICRDAHIIRRARFNHRCRYFWKTDHVSTQSANLLIIGLF